MRGQPFLAYEKQLGPLSKSTHCSPCSSLAKSLPRPSCSNNAPLWGRGSGAGRRQSIHLKGTGPPWTFKTSAPATLDITSSQIGQWQPPSKRERSLSSYLALALAPPSWTPSLTKVTATITPWKKKCVLHSYQIQLFYPRHWAHRLYALTLGHPWDQNS